jgi:CubicO group peptidase (beta-lactamase class C family)
MSLHLVAVLGLLAGAPRAQDWEMYASPAQAGFSEELLDAARARAEALHSAAVVAVHRGRVLVAWGEIERRFEVHSVRKSLVSMLVGIHVERGEIELDRTLEELGLDDVPPLTAEEKRATLRQMLAARSGVYHTAAKEPADMQAERPARGSHAPGTFFFYNNWDFNGVGILFERCTGKGLFAAFEAELARPLGMQDFRARDAMWQLEPSSSIHPAYAFRLSARDLARVGWAMADGGRWRAREIVPSAWIEESTRAHTTFDDGTGYGLMWWVYPRGTLGERAYPRLALLELFAAIGTGGQLLLVAPEAELVFVHRGDTDNGRHVRGRDVWGLAEAILGAQEAEAEAEPELVPLVATPLAGVLPPPPEREAIALVPAALEELVGEYKGDGDLRVKVHLFEGRLYALAAGLGETELRPETRERFFSPWQNVVVTFSRDASGAIDGAAVMLEGRELRVRRQAE